MYDNRQDDGKYIDIPIDQLGINPQCLARPIDNDYVKELADTDERDWEPIEVRLWPDAWTKPTPEVIYHVVSGNHRTRAALLKGCSTLRAKVIDCPDELSYLLAAIRTNARHGRNFSTDERRALAAKLVEMGQSYKQIAQTLGVSKATISGWITGNDSNASKKLKVVPEPEVDTPDETDEPAENGVFDAIVEPMFEMILGTKRTKAEIIVTHAHDILEVTHPMTVRQVYYQLVSKQVIGNSRSEYQAVSSALVEARLSGAIPWYHIEDRIRRPRYVSMWDDIADYAETARLFFRRDVWQDQTEFYVEVWLEKDALSGLFEDVLDNYGVTLNVGRGYDGWSSIYRAAKRFEHRSQDTVILYFGDFDPSGDDMVRSLRDRLARLGCHPMVEKIALTRKQIDEYKLPPNYTKVTDPRSAAFVEKHGDLSVELDALPVDDLQWLVRSWVETFMDMDALERTRAQEAADKRRIVQALQDVA